MAEPNTVETIDVCLVAPAVLDPSSVPKSLPLTFFDLRFLRLVHIERLFFYELSAPEAFFHSTILPRLKHSLSLTLGHHFLPVAGKLTWPPDSPKPILTYTQGDTVSVTVARSNVHFSLLTGTDNVFFDANICQSLVPNLSASNEQSAVLAIQITVFPNAGFSIGIANDHAVLDGISFVTFMKSWAHVCRSLGVHVHEDQQSRICLPADVEPFHDRTLINDPANLEAFLSSQCLNFEGPNNRSLLPIKRQLPPDSFRGTFQLPPEKIEKLRQLVKVNKNNQRDHHSVNLSTFSLASAYIWVCLVTAEGIKDKKVVLHFPVDLRSRLEPPLPQTYFGNCITFGNAIAETELLLGKDGFSAAVNSINKAIKKLREDWVSGFTEGASALALGRVFSIASSHRFGFYGTDFGWGQPRKVDGGSKKVTGVIFYLDGRNGDGGVQIGLVLKKHHMEAFTSLFVEGFESL